MKIKELTKWQLVSFLSRGGAMVLGLIQSFVILRILTQAEWGIVQLAVSIGGALGIYQHLGLASASTREIASTKDDTKVFKIFLTAMSIRYLVTLPLATGLFILSSRIANNIYHQPAIELPLKIYAVSLLFQSFQGILNSVVSGTKRFKHLFIYQVAIAGVSVALYIPLVYLYKITGYFYAFLGFNIIGTLVLTVVAFKPLRGKLQLPKKTDFVHLFKEIFSISIAIYLVKIIYTNWEKFGNNVLGLSNTAETVAIYGFAMLFSKKLMHISDAVTAVNLPVLSEKYKSNFEDFKDTFTKNFNKVYSLLIVSATLASFWASEIILIAAGRVRHLEYSVSIRLILPLVLAFVFYAVLNIVKSSILIPAKLIREMIIGFVLLLGTTVSSFFVLSRLISINPLDSMAWSMTLGGILSLAFVIVYSRKKLKFTFFKSNHTLLLLQMFFIGYAGQVDSTVIKLVVFPVHAYLLIRGLLESGLISKREIAVVKSKILRRFSK